MSNNNELRGRVLRWIAAQSNFGATRDEISRQFALPIQSVCWLVRNLRRRRLIYQTRQMRPTQYGRPAHVLVEWSIGVAATTNAESEVAS